MAKYVNINTSALDNSNDDNRTILLDSNGDGLDDIECEVGPYNASAMTDECRIWIEPGKWEAGEYGIKIMSNDTLWNTLKLVLYLDNHTESSNFDLAGPGYSFNNDLIDSSSGMTDTKGANVYQLSLLILLISGLLLTLRRSEN